jgi:hypothetical protein
MPIPSVSSSTSTSSISPTYAVVNVIDESKRNKSQKLPSLAEQQKALDSTKDSNKDKDNNKNSATNDADAMEIDAKQDATVQFKQKKKVLLLHARREDDDKFVNLSEKRLRPVCISGLYAGSRFQGTQKCGSSSYEVNVELLVSSIYNTECLLDTYTLYRTWT